MNDLDAVRLLAEEPTDESVSRTRHKLTRLQAAPRRHTPRWLIPAATAAAVAMVIAAGSTLMTPDDRPTPGASASPAASLSPLPLDVAKVLEDLALKAEASAAPVELKPGQLIYVKTVYEGAWDKDEPGISTKSKTRIAEDWLVPQGFGQVQQMSDGKPSTHDFEVDLKYLRRRLAAHPPNWHDQTPDWLSKLPTDPKQLHANMMSAVDKELPHFDYVPLGSVGRIFRHAGPILSPALKAALVRTLKLVPNLEAGEIVVNGRKLIVIGQAVHTEPLMGRSGIYFDPETGAVVGGGGISATRGTPVPGATGIPPKLSVTASYFETSIFTVAVVSGKGVRP